MLTFNRRNQGEPLKAAKVEGVFHIKNAYKGKYEFFSKREKPATGGIRVLKGRRYEGRKIQLDD